MSEAVEDGAGAIWPSGTVVSISRLAGRGKAMARALGIGELLDGLEVGRGLRIRLDSERALAPSLVTRIESIDPNTLRFETDNHRYELRRIAGAPSAAGMISMHDAAAPTGGADGASDRTRVVRIDPGARARPGVFEEGACVIATRLDGGEARELGHSILLSGLAPGDSLRMSTEQGVVGTSPVLELDRMPDGAVRVATANSTYVLRLAPPQAEGVGSTRGADS